MKKYLSKTVILLLLAFVSAVSSAQELTIDQIDSDSSVVKYIKQMNYDSKLAPQWNFFHLTTGKEWRAYFNFSREQIAQYQNIIPRSSWLKTDLNQDGKTDLVVSGYIARKPGDWSTATFKVLVFISAEGKRYVEVNLLSEKSEKYPAYVSPLTDGSTKYLKVNQWLAQNGPDGLPYQNDTTYYSKYWDSFLNFQSQGLRSSKITSISYKVMEDLDGSYHGLNIDLLTTKKTNMEVVVKNAEEKEPDIHRARLASDLWVHMDILIRGSYVLGRQIGDTTLIARDFNHQQLPTYLTVTYSDGHQETIRDYSPGANFSMMAIYDCMENIIQNVFRQLEQREEIMESLLSY